MEQVTVWLKRGRINRERAIVDELVALGHDALDIAAAALKLARGDEKQRTIAPVGEVEETRKNASKRFQREPRRGSYRAERECLLQLASFSRASSKSRRNRGDKDSHERGMVRLTLNVGTTHGIGPERSGRHHRLSCRYPRQRDRQNPHRKPEIIRRCARSRSCRRS